MAGKNGEIDVDWGDGTRETNVFSHTYTDDAESHDIMFYGKNTALTTLDCYINQLTQLDVSQNTALEVVNCEDNPLVTNNEALANLANSLPDRTGVSEMGCMSINNTTQKLIIQSVCDAKNWLIT